LIYLLNSTSLFQFTKPWVPNPSTGQIWRRKGNRTATREVKYACDDVVVVASGWSDEYMGIAYTVDQFLKSYDYVSEGE
jgi:hypothetical protein